MYTYNFASDTWSSAVDITTQTGLTSSNIISALSTAILNENLFVVALINQLAVDAICNISTQVWTQAFTTVQPLESLSSKLSSLTLHATPTQLYLGLGVNTLDS